MKPECSLNWHQVCIALGVHFKENKYPKVNVLCEPQLGKRGLYPTLSTKTSGAEVSLMMDLITWSDGTKSLLDIAEICDVPIWELYEITHTLSSHQLLTLFDEPVTY